MRICILIELVNKIKRNGKWKYEIRIDSIDSPSSFILFSLSSRDGKRTVAIVRLATFRQTIPDFRILKTSSTPLDDRNANSQTLPVSLTVTNKMQTTPKISETLIIAIQ